MTKYNSHIKSLRITIVPATPRYEGGQKVGDKQGQYAQFDNGQFETDDKAVIEKLESLPTYGVDFWRISDKSKKDKNETDEKESEINLENKTKKELLLLAKERNIEVDEQSTKEEIINRIKTTP